MYDYTTYDSMDTISTETLASMSVGTMIGSLAVSIFFIVCMWKIYVKAGKPGWAAIVPIYNFVVFFQIAGMNPWLLLLMFVPFANIVVMFLAYINFAKAFGKGAGFGLGLIFLNIIFFPILAFSNAEYQGE